MYRGGVVILTIGHYISRSSIVLFNTSSEKEQ